MRFIYLFVYVFFFSFRLEKVEIYVDLMWTGTSFGKLPFKLISIAHTLCRDD